MVKQKIGVFELSSCAGCQVEFLNLGEDLLELTKYFELTHFRFLGIKNPDAKIDVALVEGAVTTPEEVELLKKVRENARYVIAFGTCACFGGVPNTKDYYTEAELKKIVYKKATPFKTVSARAIEQVISVDYKLRGCPVEKSEVIELLYSLHNGFLPLQYQKSVCFECKKKNVKCLFFEEPCLGSITDGGCKARCTSNKVPCFGCRGPLDDANLDSLSALLKQQALTKTEITNLYRLFVGKVFLEEKERVTESGL